MTPCEKALIALFIVSSVSAELSVLVTGMPHYEINNGDYRPAQGGKRGDKKEEASWEESFEESYVDPNGVAFASRAEYQRFLGIDPLANSFQNEMSFQEGRDKHFVKKRVLPLSDEQHLDSEPSPDEPLEAMGEEVKT